MKISKAAASIAAAAVVLTIVAGCSKDGSSDGSTKKPDAATAKAMVLSKDQLPAGYTAMDIPADKMQEFTDSVLKGVKGAKVTPSECADLGKTPDSIDMSQVGMLVATKQMSSISESVMVGGASPEEMRKQATGVCKKFQMEFTEGAAAGAKGSVTTSVIESDVLKSTDGVVLQQDTKAVVNGQEVTTKMLVGFASINGYAVDVQAMNMGGGSIDIAGFNDFFAKAIEKAKQKSA